MAEQGDKSPGNFFTEPILRRAALGRISKMVGASVGLAIGLNPDRTASAKIALPKERIFDDLLSDELLQAAHIRIIQAPGVKLRLRKGIFEFPVFQDAREGKLKELVVVLVDHPSLSWNASNKMPEDAKLAFQAHSLNPREAPEEYWQNKQEQEKIIHQLFQEQEKLFQKMLEEIITGSDEKALEGKIAEALKMASSAIDTAERQRWIHQAFFCHNH